MKEDVQKNKAVFLDRDGTINVDKNYLYRIEDFVFLPNVIEALRLLYNAGYFLVIITNQSGIARGYYREDDFYRLNAWMLAVLEEQGVPIKKVYYCPHHPEAVIPRYRQNCACRKPRLALFERAIRELDLDISACFAVGDKIRDCAICKESACRGFLIGNNEKPEIIKAVKAGQYENIQYMPDMKAVAKRILDQTLPDTKQDTEEGL